jgi:hypothetical protein
MLRHDRRVLPSRAVVSFLMVYAVSTGPGAERSLGPAPTAVLSVGVGANSSRAISETGQCSNAAKIFLAVAEETSAPWSARAAVGQRIPAR